MNSNQLRKKLKSNRITRRFFLDVYAVDQLPYKKLRKSTWLLICNCCPAHLPGQHWIALFKKKNRIDVFDSFGQSPSAYGIDEFLNRQKLKVVYNSTTLQSMLTDVCGEYCLYFTYHRSRGESMRTIVKRLKNLKSDRDTIVQTQAVNLYKL